MSQRTNLKKAFKIARMLMPYGASLSLTARTIRETASHLPARQRQWVIRQVHTEMYTPWMMPDNARIASAGWKTIVE